MDKAPTPPPQDGRVDFAFLLCQWNVHHRLLQERPHPGRRRPSRWGHGVSHLRGGGRDDAALLRPTAQPGSISWATRMRGFQPPPCSAPSGRDLAMVLRQTPVRARLAWVASSGQTAPHPRGTGSRRVQRREARPGSRIGSGRSPDNRSSGQLTRAQLTRTDARELGGALAHPA